MHCIYCLSSKDLIRTVYKSQCPWKGGGHLLSPVCSREGLKVEQRIWARRMLGRFRSEFCGSNLSPWSAWLSLSKVYWKSNHLDSSTPPPTAAHSWHSDIHIWIWMPWLRSISTYRWGKWGIQRFFQGHPAEPMARSGRDPGHCSTTLTTRQYWFTFCLYAPHSLCAQSISYWTHRDSFCWLKWELEQDLRFSLIWGQIWSHE